MINLAVEQVVRQANEFLRRRFDLAEDIVVLSNLLEQDGTPARHVENKVAVFLANIERDSVSQRNATPQFRERGRQPRRSSPLFLNIYLMVAANFSSRNYHEALKILSSVVQFFHSKPVFDHQNTPELAEEIQQLVLDIENQTISDQSLMWGSLGGRYLPSVLYKVRMVAIDGAAVHGQVAAASSPQTSVGS